MLIQTMYEIEGYPCSEQNYEFPVKQKTRYKNVFVQEMEGQ